MCAEPAKKVVSLGEYFKDGYLLVADDVSNMRKTIKNMLRQVGVLNVVEADDGDTTLKLMKKYAAEQQRCLFALLDWNMPRMPGIYAAREIRADAQFQDTPILMVTAEVDRDQIAQAGEIGVNGYIIKPFVAKALEEKILGILEMRANPPDHIRLLMAGEALAKMGQYEKALAVYKEVLKLQESARVFVHIGDLYELMSQPDKAVESYNLAAESNPQYLKAHVKAADLHVKLGDSDAALVSLGKASEISPKNSERHVSIGKIHLQKGDEVKAKEAFTHAVKHDPRKTSEIAEELLNQGKPELAEAFFRKTLEKDSESIHLYNRLGIALRRQGKWQEAIKEYETAIKIDPRDEGIYFNMAKAYMEGKDYRAAHKFFTRVTHLNPSLQEAKRELENLEKLMQRQGG